MYQTQHTKTLSYVHHHSHIHHAMQPSHIIYICIYISLIDSVEEEYTSWSGWSEIKRPIIILVGYVDRPPITNEMRQQTCLTCIQVVDDPIRELFLLTEISTVPVMLKNWDVVVWL